MDIRKFIDTINSKGIPLPLLRDNDKKKGSVTYTIFVLSAALVAASFIFDLFIYACGSVGTCKPVTAFYPKSELLMWFGTAGGLYFGRKTFPSKESNSETNP